MPVNQLDKRIRKLGSPPPPLSAPYPNQDAWMYKYIPGPYCLGIWGRGGTQLPRPPDSKWGGGGGGGGPHACDTGTCTCSARIPFSYKATTIRFLVSYFPPAPLFGTACFHSLLDHVFIILIIDIKSGFLERICFVFV